MSNIAKRRQSAPQPDRPALNDAHNRNFCAAKRAVEIENRLASLTNGVRFKNGTRLAHGLATQTEVVARAFEDNEPRFFGGDVEHFGEPSPGRIGLAVPALPGVHGAPRY